MISAQELLDLHFMSRHERKFLLEQLTNKKINSDPVIFIGVNGPNLVFTDCEDKICVNTDEYRHITTILTDKLNDLPICKLFGLFVINAEIKDFDNISRRYVFTLEDWTKKFTIIVTLAPEEAIHLDNQTIIDDITNEINFQLEKVRS